MVVFCRLPHPRFFCLAMLKVNVSPDKCRNMKHIEKSMNTKNVYYKSDFKIAISFDGGWGVPFRLKFWANSPSRCYMATYDGKEYVNCEVMEDGRLCVSFDSHNMGFGLLTVQPTFYLDDKRFADGACSNVVAPFNVSVSGDDGEAFLLNLSLDNDDVRDVVASWGGYWQKGDKGEKGDKGDKGEKGDKGDDGGVVFPCFDIVGGHLICSVPEGAEDIDPRIVDGRLVITI